LNAAEAAALPLLPRDEGGPVFAEPWQAQAFALVVELHKAGAFSWTEWTEALTAELQDPADAGAGYYAHWLAALERLAVTKRLLLETDLVARKHQWAEAYRRTPHGSPVTL
jgi:nitrile hydratase accessory protein